jgi:tetratricopeptide (TPR) repeat protein
VIGEQGDLPGAEKLYRRVLELREKHLGPRHLEVASTLNNVAGILRQQARYSDADVLLRRALEIAEPSTDVRLTATILNTLALTLMDLHETARARAGAAPQPGDVRTGRRSRFARCRQVHHLISRTCTATQPVSKAEASSGGRSRS